MPRPAEIFFGALTAIFIAAFGLMFSPGGFSVTELTWLGGTALVMILMFAVFDVAAIRRPPRREAFHPPIRVAAVHEPEPLEAPAELLHRDLPLVASRKHETYLGGLTPFERLSALSTSTGRDPEEASDLFAAAR
jgi:hypothetical protein